MDPQITLYEYTHSGNSYKALLTAALLDIPMNRVFIDITEGKSRTAEFLAINPAGQVPLLQLEDGSFLSQSHAIIWYLAYGSDLIPGDRKNVALVQQWMNFEQYNLEVSLGVLRYRLFSAGQSIASLGPLYGQLRDKGYAALDVLEKGLCWQDFLVGNRFSLADVSLYAYTHCTAESSLSLENYPNILSWISRVEAVEGFCPLPSFLNPES